MKKQKIFFGTIILLVIICIVTFFYIDYKWEESLKISPAVGDKAITDILEPIRQKYDLPAVAAAIVNSDDLVYAGAVGVRKIGTQIPVELDDLWQTGSNTKAMTATLVACFVRDGKLNWDTTIGDVFPELVSEFDPDFSNITIEQLLCHYAGLPPRNYSDIIKGTVKEQRLKLLIDISQNKPITKPGTEPSYSNAGYIIIGAILERISEKSWEELMQTMVFEPLNMKSAGFGGTGTRGKIDQPWPHLYKNGFIIPTLTNGPAITKGPAIVRFLISPDSPLFIGPSGTVHCSIQDYAIFISDHLRGENEADTLLSDKTLYKKLHTRFNDEHEEAMGWGNHPDGSTLSHNGSNSSNFARVEIYRENDFAIFYFTNIGKGADEIIHQLRDYYLSELNIKK